MNERHYIQASCASSIKVIEKSFECATTQRIHMGLPEQSTRKSLIQPRDDWENFSQRISLKLLKLKRKFQCVNVDVRIKR